MPYIKGEKRPKYDAITEKLVMELLAAGKTVGNVEAGDLNYAISSVVWSLWKMNPRYENGNMIVGALECVKQEFIRRQLSVYEDGKIKENGDL